MSNPNPSPNPRYVDIEFGTLIYTFAYILSGLKYNSDLFHT